MELETNIQQQPTPPPPQQQQQQQRRPESVLASEAEKRASTSHGRPETRESSTNPAQSSTQRPSSKRTNEILRSRPTSRDVLTNQGIKTPHATPRDSNVTNGIDSVEDVLRSVVSGEDAVPGEKDVLDSLLDEDELFMALSSEEKEEWQIMMTHRERLLEDSKEKHQSWSDSFTRRRMFAHSRMHKLNLCYQDRIKLFSNINNTISHVAAASSSRSADKNKTPKKKTMTKTLSEPLMESKDERPDSKSEDRMTLKHSQSSGGD